MENLIILWIVVIGICARGHQAGSRRGRNVSGAGQAGTARSVFKIRYSTSRSRAALPFSPRR
jgi:hypothetical protein